MDMNQETKVTVIDDRLRQEEAETLCRWAAARAGVIVVAPLLGTMAPIANDVYLVIKLGSVYEEEIGEKAAVSLRLLGQVLPLAGCGDVAVPAGQVLHHGLCGVQCLAHGEAGGSGAVAQLVSSDHGDLVQPAYGRRIAVYFGYIAHYYRYCILSAKVRYSQLLPSVVYLQVHFHPDPTQPNRNCSF